MSIVDNHLDHLVLRDHEFCSGGRISHPVYKVSEVLVSFHLLLGDLYNGWSHFDTVAKLDDEDEGHLSKSLSFKHR